MTSQNFFFYSPIFAEKLSLLSKNKLQTKKKRKFYLLFVFDLEFIDAEAALFILGKETTKEKKKVWSKVAKKNEKVLHFFRISSEY